MLLIFARVHAKSYVMYKYLNKMQIYFQCVYTYSNNQDSLQLVE